MRAGSVIIASSVMRLAGASTPAYLFEADKPAGRRGSYLHPEEHGAPAARGEAHSRRPPPSARQP